MILNKSKHTQHSALRYEFHINQRVQLIQINHEARIMFSPYQVAMKWLKKKREQYMSFYSPTVPKGTRYIQFNMVTDPAVTARGHKIVLQ